MADTVTDPRWQQSYDTFGEYTECIADAIGRIIDAFQGKMDLILITKKGSGIYTQRKKAWKSIIYHHSKQR